MKKGKIEKAMTFVGDYLIRNSPNSQFSKPFHKEDDTNPLSSSDDLDNEAPRPVLEALPLLLAHPIVEKAPWPLVLAKDLEGKTVQGHEMELRYLI